MTVAIAERNQEDRGWRRSGSQLYKPDLASSCCPHYTIRLNSDQFHASKDQRQVQNRFNKYILGDTYIKEAARLHPLSREQAKKRDTDFDVVERVHECDKDLLKSSLEPAHDFTVTLESNDFTEEKFALYENYQRVVHNDPPEEITPRGFKHFFCSSPLPTTKELFDGQERRLGSYHECYRIDGQLIAVGVLDLLPQCVSSVYFMYHESVRQHKFGKLGALREIARAKEEGYKWWYPGFYIHSCVKMRYKCAFSPQYVLDPASYAWDLLDAEVKEKLDKTKYLSLSRERAAVQIDGISTESGDSTSTVDTSNPDPDHAVDSPNNDLEKEPTISDLEMPLFARSIPGILTKGQLRDQVDLGAIKLLVGGTLVEQHVLQRPINWDSSKMDSVYFVEGVIAELASAVGPELSKKMVVALS